MRLACAGRASGSGVRYCLVIMAKKTKPKAGWQPLKLDLGCGQRKQEGFVGVDIAPIEGVDIVHDLRNVPWPFADNSVDQIYSSHTIEHLDDLIPFFNEVHRILKPGCQAVIIAPYYSSIRCWQDPTHKQAISECTFLYYNKQWREEQGLSHYPITADFDFTYGYSFHPNWAARSDEARAFAVAHYINVVTDIQVAMTKREPGK